MTLELPVPVVLFLAARPKDVNLLEHCFTHDAVVTEDGYLFKGIPSMQAWLAELERRWPGHRMQALTVDRFGPLVRAKVRIAGDFAASPLVRVYRFVMREERIAVLEVV